MEISDIVSLSIKIVGFLFSVVALVVAWFSKRRSATQAAINQIERDASGGIMRLDEYYSDLSKRVTITEQALQYAPKAKDLNSLREQIGKLADIVAESRGAQKIQNDTLARMNQYLIDRGGK